MVHQERTDQQDQQETKVKQVTRDPLDHLAITDPLEMLVFQVQQDHQDQPPI